MNDNKSKFSIGELPQSASPSSLTVDEIAEKKKNQKKSLIKIGAMGILTLILLIFSSLSWFTMNTQVEISGMSVSTATLPFDIQSSGAAPDEYVRLFGLADREYSSGTKQGNTNTYRTGNYDAIWWRLDENDSTSYSTGFRPGASGQLNFEIVPKDENALKVNCKFNLRTFISSENAQTNVTESITEITDTSGTEIQKNARKYINGHILFFEHKTVDNKGHEIYSGFIGADGIDITVPAGGNAKSVTLYWKWVNTFDQIFLKTTDSYYDFPLIADDNTDDREDLVDFIQANPSKLFSDITTENTTAVQNIDYDADHANSTLLSAL
ncbi:MAG: hypothetical protein IJ696_03230, partial [Ruminococcus sp.]|nr:hypothetical protein [Ruminococcus sp.]